MTRAAVTTVPGELPLDFQDVEGKDLEPVPSMLNTRIAIQSLGLGCRYDIFHDRYTINGFEFGNSATQISDAVARQLREIIRLRFKFDPGAQNSIDALYRACEANRFHPILDYLDSLKWDGKPRIDKWLATYMQAEDSEFNRAVSRLLLIAAVRRVRVPGSKFDYMTVLQSPEGYGKSSALAELFGRENFTDQTILGVKDKELQEVLRGRWCVEVPELVGMKRTQIEQIKSAITRETDRARPAYGRATIDIQRSMVLIGTTNDEEYLRALSGENRRFLPVSVGRIDVAALIRDRDQLWAEASEDELLHGALALPENLWADASEVRSTRTQHDPWADVLADIAEEAERWQNGYVIPDDAETEPFAVIAGELKPTLIYGTGTDSDGNEEERVASTFVLGEGGLKIEVDRRTPDIAKRAGQVMRSLGWTGPKKARISGRPVRAYVRRIEQPWD